VSDRDARSTGALSGAALGLAAGFAVWALTVRIADVPYHYGDADARADVVRLACVVAGRRWLACAALGGAVGALAGGLLARRAGVLARAAAVATATYLLAARGAWGWDGLPGAAATRALPLAATIVPVALTAAAAIFLLRGSRREAGTPSPTDAATLAGLHLCLSFAAAHLLLQLPYYLGLRAEFFAGVADVFRIVFPG
jgi:hypothetical protein